MTHTTQKTNRRKKGLSMVLTTLIIVVASIVLGTAVTLFGTSLFQTGAQQQSMAMTNTHIWQGLNATDTTAEGAIVVRNTGDKVISIDTIKVRGSIVPFNNWYASNVTETTSSVQQLQLAYQATLAGAQNLDGVGGNDVNTGLAQQSGPVGLDPGDAVIIFFQLPRSMDATADNEPVTSADVGAAVTLIASAGTLSQVQSVSVAKNS